MHRAALDPELQDGLRVRCARDLEFFLDNFGFTYEPRDSRTYPMVLWPVQRRYLAWVAERQRNQEDGLCEKSRDMGVTYLNCTFALHRWIFSPGFKTSFCANKLDLVDELGNPDTIFEKMRMILEALPLWLKPKGYFKEDHALSGRFVNPDNGNTIIGEGGNSAGRGGRSSIYFVDEAAHIDNAEAVNAATSRNTRCRIWVSSANGMGNFFYERRESGDIPVITVHWREHPFKDDAWAVAEKKRLTKAVFAAEDDIDYAASLTGMAIEKQWIDAAVELWKRLPHPTHEDTTAGLDVGAGKDLSVYQPRRGCLVEKASSRQEGDTTDTANWALDLARKHGTHLLVYDSVGVGEGVKSTLKRGWHELPRFRIIACNWGLPPTGARRWEDGKTSKQRFANIKAEVWWLMRERFRNSYEHFLWLTEQEGGVEHDVDDCLLLEPNMELQRQLPTVRWQTTATGGKIEIESKESLARRGVKSPDYADALAYSFHVPVTVNYGEQVIIGGAREAESMF